MLQLTRKIGETICIGDKIKITILGTKGAHVVRIGIEAPKDISIYREEIYRKIREGLDAQFEDSEPTT